MPVSRVEKFDHMYRVLNSCITQQQLFNALVWYIKVQPCWSSRAFKKSLDDLFFRKNKELM